jgi:hypothetical protein
MLVDKYLEVLEQYRARMKEQADQRKANQQYTGITEENSAATGRTTSHGLGPKKDAIPIHTDDAGWIRIRGGTQQRGCGSWGEPRLG